MLLNVVCFLSLGVCGWIVSLCSGCVGCCAFCLICDACSCKCWLLLLLFAMIRSVVKSFKVPGVEVVASRMSNEAALTRMIDSTPKKTWSYLTLVLDG